MSKSSKSSLRDRYALRRRARQLRAALAPPVQGKPSGAVESGLFGELEALRQQLETVVSENGPLKEAVLRQRAEFDNFRRRVQKEKDQIRDFAKEDLIAKLLPVVDNFERALASMTDNTDAASIREGVAMISGQLFRILESEGLTKIQALGQLFDPSLHEALAAEERADVPDNSVCEEMLSGYRFKDKVIRAAMVKVAKSPATADASGS